MPPIPDPGSTVLPDSRIVIQRVVTLYAVMFIHLRITRAILAQNSVNPHAEQIPKCIEVINRRQVFPVQPLVNTLHAADVQRILHIIRRQPVLFHERLYLLSGSSFIDHCDFRPLNNPR